MGINFFVTLDLRKGIFCKNTCLMWLGQHHSHEAKLSSTAAKIYKDGNFNHGCLIDWFDKCFEIVGLINLCLRTSMITWLLYISLISHNYMFESSETLSMTNSLTSILNYSPLLVSFALYFQWCPSRLSCRVKIWRRVEWDRQLEAQAKNLQAEIYQFGSTIVYLRPTVLHFASVIIR